jgi:hypothetical protein
MTKLTRQGVRNLDPPGHNGHRNHGARCRHFFSGILVVVGQRWEADPLDGEPYLEDVWGHRCMWCSAIQEKR